MLISADYLAQQKVLHQRGTYGNSGYQWAPQIGEICKSLKTQDVLDYGCGRRTLEKSLGFDISNYDPCIEGLNSPPRPADVVVCTDVLEHIEPECLEDVLDDLQRVTKKFAFLAIANRPAGKTLPDGRNAHLTIAGPEWWLPKIWSRFGLVRMDNLTHEFIVIVRRHANL